ncbi:hypothetical protein Zm00014a_033736 [Zea mays]|uniref:Uncharacterized protein n=3 Tax=Zea mays TaxID=4577 RepID=A0A1D6HJU2_MAIZE|nr:uncharacterized protein LOC100381289 [Zea mays]AQK74728.1 hypothetical protein ZEAMMB73_Zm00001d017990 [Zea mays]PWZ23022.1 hypothetical protein Zm00014a_033736 [Zea mays]|eukprot:XP_008646235.1 uncharacterized protein LOC100381289 [Zea mays]
MKRLLAHGQSGCPSRTLVGRIPALPVLCNNVLPDHRYYSAEKHDDDTTLGEIGDKARSTAEEFLRVAKEKTDDVAEGAKETLHETKEAVVGESDDEKEKFKRRVEEGKYHHQKK